MSGTTVLFRRRTGSQHLYLTFEGLRESRNVADKLTRIRVALRREDAEQLRAQLEHHLTAPS